MPRDPELLAVHGALVTELRAQDLTDHHGLGDACAVLLLHALLKLGVRRESECVLPG